MIIKQLLNFCVYRKIKRNKKVEFLTEHERGSILNWKVPRQLRLGNHRRSFHLYFASQFLTFNVSTTPLYFTPIHCFLTKTFAQWKEYKRTTIQIIIFWVFSIRPEIILDIMEKKIPGAHICMYMCAYSWSHSSSLKWTLLLDTKSFLLST